MMKILSASSTIINSEKAAEEVIKTLLAEQVSPQLLLVYHTVSHTASSIYKQLKLAFQMPVYWLALRAMAQSLRLNALR